MNSFHKIVISIRDHTYLLGSFHMTYDSSGYFEKHLLIAVTFIYEIPCIIVTTINYILNFLVYESSYKYG